MSNVLETIETIGSTSCFPADSEEAFAPLFTARKTGVNLQNGNIINEFLRAMPESDFLRLSPHLERVFLGLGELSDGQPEQNHLVYFPESVVVSHLYVLGDGETTETAMIGKEGMIGLSTLFDSPAPAYRREVVVAGSALKAPAGILREEFDQGGSFRQLTLEYAVSRIASLSQRAACNGNHKIEERFCSWLLMIRDRSGQDRLTLTHEQIARHLGVRRAGVTDAARELRDRNVISYSRGHIEIVDSQMMERTACRCYEPVNGR
jgi:CRP-like cAMP-binding protein